MNWEELKAYFTVAQPASNQSARYKVRLLLDMLRDPTNLLYFHFVSPLVTEFERVNAFFQATEADSEEMHKDIFPHGNSLCGRVFDGDGKPLAITKVGFGGKFEHEAAKYISSERDKLAAEAKVIDIKKRCFEFLLEAVSQVNKRFPPTRDLFKNPRALHPDKVLDASKRVPYNQLPLLHSREENADVIEEQYTKILHCPWKDEPIFEGNIPSNTIQFWSRIVNFQSSLGHKPFEELANYLLDCLTNPVSNAVVERTISLVTSVKSKVRNRMRLELWKAITRVRSQMQFSKNCCTSATKRMLELFTHKNMYSRGSDSSETEHQDK